MFCLPFFVLDSRFGTRQIDPKSRAAFKAGAAYTDVTTMQFDKTPDNGKPQATTRLA
jgi:hypothetical protein